MMFFVAGEPVAQPRHRFSIAWRESPQKFRECARKMAIGSFMRWIASKQFVQPYIPDGHPVTPWKADIVAGFRAAVALDCISHEYPLEGAVRCQLVFVTKRPQALAKRNASRLWDDRGGKYGDVDNYTKAVFDALNGHAFDDDRRVCDLHVIKVLAAIDETPGVYVGLSSLSGLYPPRATLDTNGRPVKHSMRVDRLVSRPF